MQHLRKLLKLSNKANCEALAFQKESKMRIQINGVLWLLTLAFIVLKLVGTIDWSWFYVLMPTWGPIALGFAMWIAGDALIRYDRWSRKRGE